MLGWGSEGSQSLRRHQATGRGPCTGPWVETLAEPSSRINMTVTGDVAGGKASQPCVLDLVGCRLPLLSWVSSGREVLKGAEGFALGSWPPCV